MPDPLTGRTLPDGAFANGTMPLYTKDGIVHVEPEPELDAGSYVLGTGLDRRYTTSRDANCVECGRAILLDIRDPEWLRPICETCARRILQESERSE